MLDQNFEDASHGPGIEQPLQLQPGLEFLGFGLTLVVEVRELARLAQSHEQALLGGEARSIVDDDRFQPDLRGQGRDPLSDVSGAIEQQSRARAHRVEEHGHFSAALHAQVVRHRRVRAERLRRVAGGAERVAALAGRAALLQQLHRLLDDDGLEGSAAHGAGDAAVRSDDHLRSRIAGHGPRGGGDGAEDERLPRPAPAGSFREQLGIGEVHRAALQCSAAAPPKPGPGKLLLAPPPDSRLQGRP